MFIYTTILTAECLIKSLFFCFVFYLVGAKHLLALPAELTYVQRPEPPEEEGVCSNETSS